MKNPTKKDLVAALEGGFKSFDKKKKKLINPYDEKENKELWVAFNDGWLDAKLEYDKIQK